MAILAQQVKRILQRDSMQVVPGLMAISACLPFPAAIIHKSIKIMMALQAINFFNLISVTPIITIIPTDNMYRAVAILVQEVWG
jgi:hypothetical protein